MSNNKSDQKRGKLVPLLFTFAILFIVVFALGIIIGKGMGGQDASVVERTYEIGVPAEEPELEIVEETEVEEIEEPASKIKPEDIRTEKDSTPKVMEPDSKEDETIKAEDKVEGTTNIETRKEVSKPVPNADEPKAASTDDVIKEIKEESLQKTPPEKKDAALDTASMPKTDPSGQYTVQLAAFQNKEQADGLMKSMKSKGYPAFVKQYETPDKKTWYRVRVGTFSY